MQGGTDHDCGEGHYAARLLWRERAQDLVYDARAWSQGLAWTTICAGLGMFFTGLATRDAALLSSGVTAVIVAFIPRVRPVWAYQVAMTWAIKQGWAAVPAEERPLRPADEILDERVKNHGLVRVEEGWRNDEPLPKILNDHSDGCMSGHEESLLTPEEILAKRVKPVIDVRVRDEA